VSSSQGSWEVGGRGVYSILEIRDEYAYARKGFESCDPVPIEDRFTVDQNQGIVST
jgi:hypothetical protein